VVLFATTEVTVPPRLLPVMYVGEGETAGKVGGILHLLQNEEKGESAQQVPHQM